MRMLKWVLHLAFPLTRAPTLVVLLVWAPTLLQLGRLELRFLPLQFPSSMDRLRLLAPRVIPPMPLSAARNGPRVRELKPTVTCYVISLGILLDPHGPPTTLWHVTVLLL